MRHPRNDRGSPQTDHCRGRRRPGQDVPAAQKSLADAWRRRPCSPARIWKIYDLCSAPPPTAGHSQLASRLSQSIEKLAKEVVIPARALELDRERALGGVPADDVERAATQDGDVAGAVILSVARGVIAPSVRAMMATARRWLISLRRQVGRGQALRLADGAPRRARPRLAELPCPAAQLRLMDAQFCESACKSDPPGWVMII